MNLLFSSLKVYSTISPNVKIISILQLLINCPIFLCSSILEEPRFDIRVNNSFIDRDKVLDLLSQNTRIMI